MQSIPVLMLLLAFASNPLLWFFGIMKLAQNYPRFSLRALLIAMTVMAALLGIGPYAVRMIAQS
jgi:hypothetical protein